MVDYRSFTAKPAKVEALLKLRLKNGERTQERLPEKEQLIIARQNMDKDLAALDPSYKRILNPHVYKVSVTEGLKDLKLKFIQENLK